MSNDIDAFIWSVKMLSARQLLEKISLGETSSLEFKSVTIAGNKVRDPGRDDLSDEIAAFANQRGGMIVFGVSDERIIEGVGDVDDAQTLIHFISEICHDSIKPPLVDFSVEGVLTPDEEGNDKILVYIEISRSLRIHKTKGGYFFRSGSSKREMTYGAIGQVIRRVAYKHRLSDLKSNLYQVPVSLLCTRTYSSDFCMIQKPRKRKINNY